MDTPTPVPATAPVTTAAAPAPTAPAAPPAPVAALEAGEVPLESLPADVQSYVKKLRTENQNYRARAKLSEFELSKIKTGQEESARKAAEEQGQFKQLYESERQKREAVEQGVNMRIAQSDLRAAAVEAGILDKDLVRLIPMDGIQIDAAGNVLGIEETLAHLKATKPHFFRTTSMSPAPVAPQHVSPVTGAPVPTPRQAPEQGPTNVKQLDAAGYRSAKKQFLQGLRGADRRR